MSKAVLPPERLGAPSSTSAELAVTTSRMR
jgi:hypothetical protein